MNFLPAPGAPVSKPTLFAALAGALGGLLSFFVGEITNALFNSQRGATSWSELVWSSALWSGAIGLTIGVAILIYDNRASLRGQWHRDVLRALPLFFALSFAGGAAGQLAYLGVQNSFTRGIGWSLMGAGVGVGIGVLRRDPKQAGRGALGGALGGFAGGFLFNALAMISVAGDGSFSRLVGQILMGALVAGLMRVVQEALKDAYLLGVSTGPYEGKEYPLNTARVSVGRASDNDISLFREETGPLHLGALIFQNENWYWQGEAVEINGAPQSNALLASGDTLQLGATRFRFKTRAGEAAKAPTSSATARTVPAPIVPERAPSFALLLASGEKLRVPDSTVPISVGRAAQNGLVLSDAGVSSHHATLQVAQNRLQVCDLNSTNGTFVNGVKIAPQTPQPLQIGDRVRFGSLEITVVAA